jgi:hypothetical protein
MSNRITEKMLRSQCDFLNELTDNPLQPYTDGKANIGNYHISFAYGGVGLHQTMNTGGGIKAIISGYTPKRELFNKIEAYTQGFMTRE